MSLDNALRALAFSEAQTLGEGLVLIAKHRNDLAAALRRAELEAPAVTADGAGLARALGGLQTPVGMGQRIDRSA